MGDFIQLFTELKGVLGGAAAVGVSVALYLWSQRGQRQLDGANTEANVSAIAHWKDVAERSDTALVAMTARADKFAEERNEAYKQLARMEGQLAEMNRQLEAQNLKLETQSKEMQGLRDQVRNLQEQIHAPR
ncbi:hypothetical protein AB4142_19050 [Variovorax sp. 2RAF20]|jgi:chromosome segregation ATPase